MNSTTLLVISVVTVVFAMLATSSEADAAIYVKIQGVPGDTGIPTPGYNDGNWFVADSFSFGVEREMKESGEKAGTEDINIGVGELQECTISKSLDKASAKLAQFAVNGNSLGPAEIHFVEVGGERAEPYLVYKLDRVFVKSWSTSGDADDRPTENVSFNYNKIAFGTKTSNDPAENPENVMSWDLKKNQPWTSIIEDILSILFPR